MITYPEVDKLKSKFNTLITNITLLFDQNTGIFSRCLIAATMPAGPARTVAIDSVIKELYRMRDKIRAQIENLQITVLKELVEELQENSKKIAAKIKEIKARVPSPTGFLKEKTEELGKALQKNEADISAVKEIKKSLHDLDLSIISALKEKHGTLIVLLTPAIDEEKVINSLGSLTSVLIQYMDELIGFEAHLEKDKARIEEILVKSNTFSMDIGAFAGARGIPTTDETIAVLDADFTKHIQDLRDAQGKAYLRVVIPWRIIIPREVYNDMTKTTGKYKEGLIKPEVMDYLLTDLNAKVVDVDRTPELVKEVLRLWDIHAEREKSTEQITAIEPEKIKAQKDALRSSKGEMGIMLYLLQTPPDKPVIVLSNDSDTRHMIVDAKRDGMLKNVVLIVNDMRLVGLACVA